MAGKRIVLYFKDIPISTLSYEDETYVHQYNHANLEIAFHYGCHAFILGSREGKLDELPPIFHDFDISPQRTDLLNKLGIKKGDSPFEKLYKIASHSDSFSKDDFWIDVERPEA